MTDSPSLPIWGENSSAQAAGFVAHSMLTSMNAAWFSFAMVTNRRAYNQVANQTYVEWHVNNDIGDQSPVSHAPVYSPTFSPATHALHALPDAWWEIDFAEFWVKRRKLMADVIRRDWYMPKMITNKSQPRRCIQQRRYLLPEEHLSAVFSGAVKAKGLFCRFRKSPRLRISAYLAMEVARSVHGFYFPSPQIRNKNPHSIL